MNPPSSGSHLVRSANPRNRLVSLACLIFGARSLIFAAKSKRQNHSRISDLDPGWFAPGNQAAEKKSAHETIWRLHGGPLRDSETPPPLLRRVAAEVFRLASISRPLMRPRRGVGVSPPGIISRRRRIHPVDRNNNKQFSGPVASQLPRPVPPYCFGRRKDPGVRGEPSGLWPMPASPGDACDGSEAAACPGLRSPEAFAAAPPHCAACRRPNRT